MARKQPAPISLKKPRAKKRVEAAPVQAFNKDAPEHKPKAKIKVVRDKALEARVAQLEKAEVVTPHVTVQVPDRPRIQSISIEYDALGHPKTLVPAYGE